MYFRKLLTFLGLICMVSMPAFSQNLGFERDRHKTMLEALKNDVKKHYYDPTLKGIDIEAKYKAALAKIEQAASIGQMSGIVAQFLLDFDDSHLFFLPPGKTNKTEYGFEMQMVGERCLVNWVDPKSDAARKGLSLGDEIYSLEGFGPTRETLWKMKYFYNVLRPRPVLKAEIIKPDGKEIAIEIEAKITMGKQIIGTSLNDWQEYDRKQEDEFLKSRKQYYFDKIAGLFIWRMPSFNLEPSKVDDIIADIRSKNASLIIDLRNNGGGRVDMLLRLIGNVFAEDIKVADEKKRKETKEVIAKSRGKNTFGGKIAVLIDSESGSASEVFARVLQIEKRGGVIGDTSAGAVMESLRFGHQTGVDIVAFYGASITIADLIMKDGKSLEKTGVQPDIKIIPSPLDLAERRDPALAKAAEFLGFKLSPEEAGKIFPEEKK